MEDIREITRTHDDTGSTPVHRHYGFHALLSLVVLGFALLLVYLPSIADIPLTKMINAGAHRSVLLDMLAFYVDTVPTMSGIVLVSLLASCWFYSTDRVYRSRILVGTLIAFPIGVLSRFLQHRLPTHPRPLYDPALRFQPPYRIAAEPLNTWNSFPSDHATTFGALVVVVLISRPKFAWFLLPWFIVVELVRTYTGDHYPSDLIGGVALGATAIFAAQAGWLLRVGQRVLHWGLLRPALFYTLGFFITYQIGTLFLDVRNISGGLLYSLAKAQ